MASLLEERQLHLKVAPDNLPLLVREIAKAALQSYLKREPNEMEIREAMVGVKNILRQVVIGYDLCGLTVVCKEAEEFDPWADLPDAV